MRNVICLSVPVQSETDELKICVTEVNLFDFTLGMNEVLHYHGLPPAEILASGCPYLHIRSMNQEIYWSRVVCAANTICFHCNSECYIPRDT